MTDNYSNDFAEASLEESTKSNNKTLWIILAVVLVVLCCCLVFGVSAAVWLWNNGDELFGLAAELLPVVVM